MIGFTLCPGYLVTAFLTALLLCAAAQAGPDRYFIIGDLEGMNEGLQTYLDSHDLKLVNGHLDFTKPNTGMVMLGDLPDRGPWSIRLRKLLSDLHHREPSRTTLIMGNREGNKFNLLRDLPDLQSLKDPDYQNYLAKLYEKKAGKPLSGDPALRHRVLSSMNRVDNQVDYWLKNHGAPQGLEFHRVELTELNHRPMTAVEAAQDYVKSMQPGGEQWEYIKRAKIVSSNPGEDFVSVHGGLTEANYGRVPGDTHVYENPEEWDKALEKWKLSEMDKYEKAYKSGQRGMQLPKTLGEYLEAIWDPHVIDFETGRKGMLTFNDQSPVYPFRSKEGDNFRPLPKKISDVLAKYGKHTVYNGHSPSPNGPTVTNDGQTLNVMADTSMSTHGEGVKVYHNMGGGLETEWHTGDGTKVAYSVKPGSDTLIGKITDNGYAVNGFTPDGRVVLSKYSDQNRFKIEEEILPRSEVEKLNPKLTSGGSLDTDASRYLGNIQKALREQKNVVFMTAEEALASASKKKYVLNLMSASKLGQLPTSEVELQKLAEKVAKTVVDKYGASNIQIFWGATDASKGELAFIKEFEKLKVPEGNIIGFANKGLVFSDVGSAKRIVISGETGDWAGPIKKSVQITQELGGDIIAMGGGGITKEVLGYSQEIGANVHVLKADPAYIKATPGATGGASAELASQRPDLAFSNAEELQAKLLANKPGAIIGNVKGKQLKVGIYTGSFDPPHSGHKNIVDEMKKKFRLDEIYVVPDRTTAYKPGMRSYDDRKKMVELMFKDDPGVHVLSPEMEAKLGKGEMWDVLRTVQATHPNAKMYNIMGTDTFQWYSKLPTENRPKGVTLLVNSRDRSVSLPKSLGGGPVVGVELNDRGISSTQIRNQIAAGRDSAELTPEVKSYIAQNHLYAKVAQLKSVSAVEAIQELRGKGKQIVTLLGYSAGEYEDETAMLKRVKEILSKYDPAKTIVNIGGTEDGIGKAYKLAKSAGFETAGIVSERALAGGKFSPYVDQVYAIKDETWGGYKEGTHELTDTSKAMVGASDRMYGIGGNAIARDEMTVGHREGKPVEFTDADMNHTIAIDKALAKGQPVPTASDFRGVASRDQAQYTPTRTVASGAIQSKMDAARSRIGVLDPKCVDGLIEGF
jgi:nicotinate-nucleotide adenylyltransferase